MIVVDANVIVYHAIKGPMTPLVETLRSIDPIWCAPRLWRYEMTSAAAVMLKARVIDEATALESLAWAQRIMADSETDVPQDLALRNVQRYGISAYDAQYIALAQILGVKCVTADASLARKTPEISVLLSETDRLKVF